MPIRRKVVDFYGGYNNGESATSVTWGWLKNHRGMDDITDEDICGSNTTEWGKQGNACDNRYYEEIKTYMCNEALASEFGECGGAINDPDRIYPGMEGNVCVYRPRIQLMDNWGSCNGVCEGTPAGDDCINREFGVDVDPSVIENECAISDSITQPFEHWDTWNQANPGEAKYPWTWYDGEIKITSS